MYAGKWRDCAEYCVRIPRNEVEEIAERILEELRTIMPGSDLIVCGGYVLPMEVTKDRQ
jgi:hypothetical protein